MVFHHLPNSVQ